MNVILWYRYNEKEKQWDYNHLEEGLYAYNYPLPIVPGSSQENWRKGKWRKEFKLLIDGKVT